MSTARRAARRIGQQYLIRRLLRWAAWPEVIELAGSANGAAITPLDALLRLGVPGAGEKWAAIESEFDQLDEELRKASAARSSTLNYPGMWGTERPTSLVLYGVVRLCTPRNLCETGVANGHSTYFLLSALQRNGEGRLTSLDIASDVGALLTPELRSAWTLELLDLEHPVESFRQKIDQIGSLDLFLHDSDHSYWWQTIELESAAAHMSEGGVIIADDAHTSYAFLDFCRRREITPVYLFDGLGMTGIARISHTSHA